MKKVLSLLLVLLITQQVFTQEKDVEAFDPELINWFHQDINEDEVMGASIDKAYRELLKDLEPKKTVVVAVIDGGVDIEHEDLEGKIWTNEDEIAGNGIDDDQNGYVDDLHGWNFIGNAKGENILYENLEMTRIVRERDSTQPYYEEALKEYENLVEKKSKEKKNLDSFLEKWESAHLILKDAFEVEVQGLAELEKIEPVESHERWAKEFLSQKYSQGATQAGLNRMRDRNSLYLDHYLNLDFEPRSLTADDPDDLSDRNYGNPDVIGPRADHGTSVAGIIAANRQNKLGIKGVAESVEIMAIRSTPDGDERDKDVALGIIYAVDNGADIINMSFGKGYSPNQAFLDSAILYAQEKGVLLVHAAGNEGKNIDRHKRFPSDMLTDGREAENFLNVGANKKEMDKMIAGVFSNYGATQVDLFAPGVDMISLDSSSTYSQSNGTSIAAPVVSGVAALVLAYYPELKAKELIELLMESSYKPKKPRKVYAPNLASKERSKNKFSELAKSGGIINAYRALQLAEERSTE